MVGTSCSYEKPDVSDSSTNSGVKGVSYSDLNPNVVQYLSQKSKLNSEDMKFIFSLPREERVKILERRGWHLIEYKGNSYLDNALNYQLEAEGENVSDYRPVKKKISRNRFMELKKACMEKEKCIPWEQFKSVERWQPSENDSEVFSIIIEQKELQEDARNDHHNSVDFWHLLSLGDPIVVHDGFSPVGHYCHAGIGYVNGPTPMYKHVISSYRGRGVLEQSFTVFNGYDEGALLRVNTSISKRITAQNYAYSKIGYPYNDNWYNKWTTSKFYCSQLVWAAYYWTSPRIDIDATEGFWSHHSVSPDDIYNDGDTYVVQHSW